MSSLSKIFQPSVAAITQPRQFGGTQGETMAETLAMTQSLLMDMTEPGQDLGSPISPDRLRADHADLLTDAAKAQIIVVPHTVTTAAQRLNITLPADTALLLETRVQNKSQYIADLVRRDLA